ncbi:MAG: hypothetical protein ACI9LM_003404 [Alteromonadaceae bacterium]|jgi:hypothetical protein
MIGTENGVYAYQNGVSEVFTPTNTLLLSLRTKNKNVFRALAGENISLMKRHYLSKLITINAVTFLKNLRLYLENR